MLIPPVTIGGKSSPVVANLFDSSGTFRQRTASVKRGRYEGGDGGTGDGYYDLSGGPSVATLPINPKLDVSKIRGLMVKANDTAATIRTLYAGEAVAAEVRELAGLSLVLLDLVSAVVEDGILPLSSGGASASFASVAAAAPAASRAPSKPVLEPGTAELRAALAAADKSAVVFDVGLGPSPVANRASLNAAFTGGLKDATLKVVGENVGELTESIRIVNDALSCADNVEFLGRTSSQKIDKKDPHKPIVMPYCTMPVKLDFPDRNTRIHFERTLKKHCNLKATISLPPTIWKYQSLYLKAMRERHAGKVVMVRPDIASMSLVAFLKEEGDPRWTRCPGSWPIPRGIMLPDYVVPNRIDLPMVDDSELGDEDAMLVAASIGAESQP
jgi:hypothetical protein